MKNASNRSSCAVRLVGTKSVVSTLVKPLSINRTLLHLSAKMLTPVDQLVTLICKSFMKELSRERTLASRILKAT